MKTPFDSMIPTRWLRGAIAVVALAGLGVAGGCAEIDSLVDGLGDDPDERTGYVIGHQLGTEFNNSLASIVDAKGLEKGFIDALHGVESKITKEEGEALLQKLEAAQAEHSAEMMARQAEQQLVDMNKNTAAGEAFRTEYKGRENTKTTKSGLMYQVEKSGSSKRPSQESTVEVHYRGTLVDGTEFDSSYSRNKSATFPLNGVIPGWTEGLQLIGEGGAIELVIPPELAYGDRGAGGVIGPGATLMFKVELIAVDPKPASTEGK